LYFPIGNKKSVKSHIFLFLFFFTIGHKHKSSFAMSSINSLYRVYPDSLFNPKIYNATEFLIEWMKELFVDALFDYRSSKEYNEFKTTETALSTPQSQHIFYVLSFSKFITKALDRVSAAITHAEDNVNQSTSAAFLRFQHFNQLQGIEHGFFCMLTSCFDLLQKWANNFNMTAPGIGSNATRQELETELIRQNGNDWKALIWTVFFHLAHSKCPHEKDYLKQTFTFDAQLQAQLPVGSNPKDVVEKLAQVLNQK
jgi:hypothetical protein